MICARTDGRIIRKLRRVWELPSHHFGSEEWTKKVWVACGTDGTQAPLHSQSGGFSNAVDANKDEITTGQVITLPLHCAGYTPPSTAHKVLRHSPARPRINAVMMGKKTGSACLESSKINLDFFSLKSYLIFMEIIHYRTEDGVDLYQRWVDGLRDTRAKVAILRRIDRAATGNFGDHKFCRDGVYEMRIDLGPGYRVYYFQHQGQLVVVLCGGDKQTQDADISRAVACRADFLRRMNKP